MTLINKILSALAIVVLCGSFIVGCQYGKSRVKCPTITHDTTYIHDTVTHVIIDTFPYYIQGKDSIIYQDVPQNVDTALILKDYYAKHIYPRKWENDTLKVVLSDTISQNKSIGNLFTYKIKTPFITTINNIDNSVTYDKYVYIGGSSDLHKRVSLEATFAGPKSLLGVGYSITSPNYIEARAAFTLFKFKKRK